MRTLILMSLFIFNAEASAYDCAKLAPFSPVGQFTANVTVSRLSWDQGVLVDEDVCSQSTRVNWFDVRGREAEAYACLKPLPSEIIS